MIIATKLPDVPFMPLPCGLTIGSFDGVHLGHQYLLEQLRKKVSPEGSIALLTFKNHPSEVLQNHPPVTSLYSLDQKIQLLEDFGIDLLILLEFTKELAALSFDVFLGEVKKYYPFSYLLLGKGATFGKGKQGDETHVKALGLSLAFEADYLEKFQVGGEIVSSGKIRTLIENDNLEKASVLLGRPYTSRIIKRGSAPPTPAKD